MKKLTLILAFCFIFSCSAVFSQNIHGQFNMAKRFEMGLDFGAYGPDSMSGNGNYLDTEFSFGGNLKYYFTPNFALGVNYHVWDHDDNFPATQFHGSLISGVGIGSYDEYGRGSFNLDIDTFDVTAYYYFSNPTNKKVRPYLGIGATHFSVGYSYVTDTTAGVTAITPGTANAGTIYESLNQATTLGGIASPDWASFNEDDNTWGFHVVGGIEYWPNPDFSIRGEVKYMDADVSLNMARDMVGPTVGARVHDQETLDLSGFYYGIGFTYHFDGPGTEYYGEEQYVEEEMIY
jgi:hypothetical protein